MKMARMRMRARSFATVLAVGVTALTLSMQSASASLNIPSTTMKNNASGNCVIERNRSAAGIGDSCGYAGTYFHIISAAPDAGGAAYVQIQTTDDDPSGRGYCLYAVGQGTGPSGAPAASSDVELIPCSYNDPRAIWAVARAGATVNGITPETFFAFDGRVCLDGGFGTLYAYREEGCNGGNAWQRWDVYTG
ncbi:hypothetical protein ACFWIJ_04120 [Streptomyces sp. NPDC127079]|uniref:hypothetical protein n=1 Tax=Streptomyces sp. NPDC127079 TaxID=3347132 RepID=UPI003664377E